LQKRFGSGARAKLSTVSERVVSIMIPSPAVNQAEGNRSSTFSFNHPVGDGK
jgi:hypothetical protein